MRGHPVHMTALPPDPDPARIPDPEPGGGVAPGSTPPDSAQTSGLSAPEPRTRKSKLTPTAAVTLAAVVLLVVLFAGTGILLLLQMAGVFN